jgi:hypothetical protein
VLFGQTHDLVEGPPAVVFPHRIALVVSDMAICGDKNSNGICVCVLC